MLRLSQRSPKGIKTAAAGAEEATPLAILEFQSPTSAIIAMPIPAIARHTVWWISLMLFSMLVVARFMPIDELVTATGELSSTAQTSVIQPFNNSIIKSINVSQGDFVHKGQILATLDPTDAAADLTALTTQQQAYAAQVAQLTAQENGTMYSPDPTNPASALQLQTYDQQVGQYNATVQDYNEKIKELQTQIDGFNEQAAYYKQRLAIADNIESMRKNLQQLQVGSKLDTLSATDERVTTQASLADALSSAAADEREMAAQVAERDSFEQQFKASISQQLSEALNNLTQAQQNLTKAKLNNELVVMTAPQDSIVQSVAQTSPGSVLAAGSELMELVPVNAPFIVSAEITGDNSGYLTVGNPVVIKFATLPFTQFGDAKGTVISVSPSSFNPADKSDPSGTLMPGTPAALFYQIQVSVDELNLHNTPPGFRLVPGMPVEADVVVGTHTVMDYFTAKILPVAYESLHEPGST